MSGKAEEYFRRKQANREARFGDAEAKEKKRIDNLQKTARGREILRQEQADRDAQERQGQSPPDGPPSLAEIIEGQMGQVPQQQVPPPQGIPPQGIPPQGQVPPQQGPPPPQGLPPGQGLPPPGQVTPQQQLEAQPPKQSLEAQPPRDWIPPPGLLGEPEQDSMNGVDDDEFFKKRKKEADSRKRKNKFGGRMTYDHL